MEYQTVSYVLGSLLVLAAGYLLWILLNRKRTPPGPLGLPVVGYIPFLSTRPYLDFQRLAEKYGNVFSLRLGSFYSVVLNDFESTRDAFSQDAFIGRPPITPFPVNAKSIETEAFSGLPWKNHRRFSLHMLRDLGFGKTVMEGHIQEEILELLNHLEKEVDKPTNVRHYLTSSTSNNIAALLFGKRYPYNDPVRVMMTKTLDEIDRIAGQVQWQVLFPWLKNIVKYVVEVDKISGVLRELRKYILKEIEEHEKTLNPDNIRDYIDGFLLEMRKRDADPSFCKEVLQDMANGFFGAGSGTIRGSVEWLMLVAAEYPDVQRKVQSEIDEVLGSNRLPTYEYHKNMPFTEAVIAEVMRWRTATPVSPLRYTLQDTELNGYFIPKHTYVFSNMWAIHHDPKFWGEDAELFRPERFLSKDGKSVIKSERFMPFSIGKRACPGEPMARIEVFLYFVSILQRFNISLPEGKKADFDGHLGILLQPKLQDLVLRKRRT